MKIGIIRQTSGFPVERMRTKDDLPTFGAPTRQRVGISKSTTGIALKTCKIISSLHTTLTNNSKRSNHWRGKTKGSFMVNKPLLCLTIHQQLFLVAGKPVQASPHLRSTGPLLLALTMPANKRSHLTIPKVIYYRIRWNNGYC